MTLVPGAEEMVLDIYRNRSKSGKLNNQLGEERRTGSAPCVSEVLK